MKTNQVLEFLADTGYQVKAVRVVLSNQEVVAGYKISIDDWAVCFIDNNGEADCIQSVRGEEFSFNYIFEPKSLIYHTSIQESFNRVKEPQKDCLRMASFSMFG